MRSPHYTQTRQFSRVVIGGLLAAALQLSSWGCAAVAEPPASASRTPGPAASTASSPTTPGASWVAPELQHQFAGAVPALPVLPGAPPIGDCAQLIAVLRSNADLGERAEMPQFNAYALCIAAALAADARQPTGASRFDRNSAAAQIVAHLDLASVRSSLAPRRPAAHYTLSDFRFESTKLEPLSVELVGQGFRYRFDVLAMGDFSGAGGQQSLVKFTDRALGGTYDRSTILVLSWPTGQVSITATDGLDLLRRRPTGR